jgi:ribose 5-phosphate isomerase B
MKVALASDHAGFELKAHILDSLSQSDLSLIDLGTDLETSRLSRLCPAPWNFFIENRADRGILICGSGVGASVAAN